MWTFEKIGYAPADHPWNCKVRAQFKSVGFQRIRLWLNRDLGMLSFRFLLGAHAPFKNKGQAHDRVLGLLNDAGFGLRRDNVCVWIQGDLVDGAFGPPGVPPEMAAEGPVAQVGASDHSPAQTVTRRKRGRRSPPPRELTAEEAEAVRRLCDRAWVASEKQAIEQLGPELLNVGNLADPVLKREVDWAFCHLLAPEMELGVNPPDYIMEYMAEWCRYLLTQPRERAKVLAKPVQFVREALTGEAAVAYEQLLNFLETNRAAAAP